MKAFEDFEDDEEEFDLVNFQNQQKQQQQYSFKAPKTTNTTNMRKQNIAIGIPDAANNHSTSSSESDQNMLEMLQSTATCLKGKKMDVEALGCLEQSLWLKRRMFGLENTVVHKTLKEVVLGYNSIAMQFLAQGEFDQCLTMLRKAEQITTPGNFKKCQSLQILTYNNIGCCYRKLGKLKAALKYLKEAAEIGAGSSHVKNLSITHLNLCAIHSQLGRHDLALEHAQAAIFHTQEELVTLENEQDELAQQDGTSDVLDAKSREEKIVSLAVAYHNLAVELEFNGREDASLQWYKKALQLVWKYRETNEALCKSFKKIFLDAKKKHEANSQQQQQQTNLSNSFSGVRRKAPGVRPTSARSTHKQPSKPVATSSPPKAKPGFHGSATFLSASKKQRPVSAMSKRPVSAMSKRPVPKAVPPGGINRNRGGWNDDQQEHLDESEMFRHQNSMEHLLQSHQRKANQFNQMASKGIPMSTWSAPTVDTNSKHKRPQSAMPSRNVTFESPPKKVPLPQRIQKAHSRQRQEEEDFEDDIALGIINDDDDDDDDNEDLDVDNLKSQPTKGARHRQAVYKNRERQRQSKKALHQKYFDQDDEDQEEQQDEEDVSSAYLGEDEISSVVTDMELPNRMSHMEYLRQMKAKAQSIQQELDSVSKDTSSSKSAEKVEEEVDPLVSAKATVSKVRARLEEFKAEAAKNQTGVPEKKIKQVRIIEEPVDLKTDSTRSPDITTTSASNSTPNLQVLVESVYEYDTVADLLEGERLLLENAASKRVQTFFRGKKSKNQLRKLKEAKAQQKAAETIQSHTRRYLIRAEEERRAKELKDQQEQQARELRAAQQKELEFFAAQTIQQEFKRFQRKRIAQAGENQEPQNKTNDDDTNIQPEVLDSTKDEPPVEVVPLLDLKQVIQLFDPLISAQLHQSSTDQSNSSRLPLEQQMISFPPPEQLLISSRVAKQAEEQQLIRNMAASHIQAFFKGVWVRLRLVEMHARRMSRDYLEKNHMRVEFEKVMAMEEEYLKELSATKIQAIVRGNQTRLLTEAIKVERTVAAERIQHSVRQHQARQIRAVKRGIRSIAARMIQSAFRQHLRRKARETAKIVRQETHEVEEIAATTLQRFWKAMLVAREEIDEEGSMATSRSSYDEESSYCSTSSHQKRMHSQADDDK